jgi:hypothetical protein
MRDIDSERIYWSIFYIAMFAVIARPSLIGTNSHTVNVVIASVLLIGFAIVAVMGAMLALGIAFGQLGKVKNRLNDKFVATTYAAQDWLWRKRHK